MCQSRNHTSACSLISHRELTQIHVKVKQDKNKKNREEKMPINKGRMSNLKFRSKLIQFVL